MNHSNTTESRVSLDQTQIDTLVSSITEEIRGQEGDGTSREHLRNLRATINQDKTITIKSYGFETTVTPLDSYSFGSASEASRQLHQITSPTLQTPLPAMEMREMVRFVNLLHFCRYQIKNRVPTTNGRQQILIQHGKVILMDIPRIDDQALPMHKRYYNQVARIMGGSQNLTLASYGKIRSHQLSFAKAYLDLYLAQHKTRSGTSELMVLTDTNPEEIDNVGLTDDE